jgi:hypothetical protein
MKQMIAGPGPETPQERRRRIGLEAAIKRRARSRYRIQINLPRRDAGDGIWPAACSLPFLCGTADEAWRYIELTNPFKRFPEARSISVEHVAL